ncbi:hypothetical protein WJX73_007868 [Symbiochloris irregularis]|uniref:Steroid 5-alpha reductase C-terminal domain-containing protein n=1 Tax=Symbiochloris irregularis TaxID=706552 RepID=A0AAW1P1B8_9CHLO
MWTIGSLSIRESAVVGSLILDFAIQLSALVIAASLRTDKFYDLLGSTNFIAAAIATLTYAHYYHARQIVVTVFVCCWALRLGSLLFYRVLKTGGDSRFKDIKDKPHKFFVAWFLQACWVFIVLLPVVILNGTQRNRGLWASDIIGGIFFWVGWTCEATADFQKLMFKRDPANKGKFINVGLWAYARYPNYFGEILQWWGIWLMCIAALTGAYWVSVVSPLFTMLLTLGVSGVPMQEKQQAERWGKDPAFQAWKKSTHLLVPLPKIRNRKDREAMRNIQAEQEQSSQESEP